MLPRSLAVPILIREENRPVGRLENKNTRSSLAPACLPTNTSPRRPPCAACHTSSRRGLLPTSYVASMDFDKLFAGPAVLAKQLETRWGEPSSSSSSSAPPPPPPSSSSSSQWQETPVPAAIPTASSANSAGGSEVSVSAGTTDQKSKLDLDADPDTIPDANTSDEKQLRGSISSDIIGSRGGPVSMVSMNRPYLRRTLLYCRDPLDKNYFPLWKNTERSADVGQELPQLDMLAQLFDHSEPKNYNMALLEGQNAWQHRAGINSKHENDEEEGIYYNNNSDGVSINSSEENSFRDVSVSRTPPPRKRKRRITPTTTPASISKQSPTPASTPNRESKTEGGVPSTPESGVGGAVSSPSSSVSSSSSRQHTKLFYDVQMAQSPSKALSPTTAEMKYGKAFPPYEPRNGATGKWIQPQKPRSAFELFVHSTRGQARLHLKRRDRNNQEKVDEQLEKLWASGSTTTALYWKQEEEWDRQRYLHEKGLYTRAQQLAANYAKAGDAISCRNHYSKASASGFGRHGGPFATTSNLTSTILPRRVAAVYYHYFYHRSGLPVAQIERRDDCRCPLCFENCITDVGLVMHCQIVHGNGLLSFQGMKDEDGTLHIGIHPKIRDAEDSPWSEAASMGDNLFDCVRAISHQRGWDPANALQQKPLTNARLRNFLYSRRETHGPRLAVVPFVKRPFTAAAALDVQDRKKKTQFLRDQGVGEDALSRIVPNDQIPVRQYYHSKTNLPMRRGEWVEDSDDESDDSWIEKKSSLLIDEFDDVSEKEKYFLKLWNCFVSGSHKLVADRGVPSRCTEFIKVHGIDIAQQNMRDLLLLHFCNLWDEEILSSDHISTLMALFDRQCAAAVVPTEGKTMRALPTCKSPNHRKKTPTKHGHSSQKAPGRSRMSATRKRARRCIAF